MSTHPVLRRQVTDFMGRRAVAGPRRNLRLRVWMGFARNRRLSQTGFAGGNVPQLRHRGGDISGHGRRGENDQGTAASSRRASAPWMPVTWSTRNSPWARGPSIKTMRAASAASGSTRRVQTDMPAGLRIFVHRVWKQATRPWWKPSRPCRTHRSNRLAAARWWTPTRGVCCRHSGAPGAEGMR